MSDNTKLNIILGVICVVFIIVILYIISYRNNIESTNIYFDKNKIVNVEWKNEEVLFKTDGNKFTFKKNDEVIFNNENFDFDRQTGMIIDGRLYIRSVNQNDILIWFDEAEYKLNRS